MTGSAIAGALGGVEAAGPPFTQTDPFSEAVRLGDGTCVGWADSQGRIDGRPRRRRTRRRSSTPWPTRRSAPARSRPAAGRTWPTAASSGTACSTSRRRSPASPAEFRVRVGSLEPWLARPDPSDPGTFVASVSTDASIGQIPSCPPVPGTADHDDDDGRRRPRATTTTTHDGPRPARVRVERRRPVLVPRRRRAVLRRPAGHRRSPARAARPASGSEYISAVVDSADSTVTYANGAAIPAGTALTVVVPIARLCT